MPLDDRHHRFAVMIDVAKTFFIGKEIGAKLFPAFEQLMRANAYKGFRVGIVGIYWRICETEDQFERGTRAGDSAGTQKPAPVVRVQHPMQAHSAESALPTRAAASPSGAHLKTVSLPHSL